MALGMAATLVPVAAGAQDKVEASVGADLVSSYIWRGQELGDVSIQPSVSLSWKAFRLRHGVQPLGAANMPKSSI